MTTRRNFLKLGAASVGASLSSTSLAGAVQVAPAQRPLSILVLGGTGFIGPHQIELALARGHQLSMFNRGRREGLFDGKVEQLIGNRDSNIDDGLKALTGKRTWDVVIDNSGYVPRQVSDSAKLLKGRCKRYIYTSTVSVYDFERSSSFAEIGPLAAPPAPEVEEVTGETYGPLKSASDQAARRILGQACTVIRPTYVVGPGDRSDRFTYWVDRIHRGGDILAPSGPQRSIQWVDVRDLAAFIVDCAEQDRPGVYNACGPTARITRQGMLWGIAASTSAPVRMYWPDDALLDEMKISLPMLGTGDYSFYFDNAASLEAGASYRPLARTVADTLQWWQSQTAERRENARGWPSGELEGKALKALMKG